MSESSPSPSPAYLECARHLVHLHELIRNGEGGTDEADGIRDVMDGLWRRLAPRETDLIRRLSADLDSLGRGPAPPPAEAPPGALGVSPDAVSGGDKEEIPRPSGEDAGAIPAHEAALTRGLYWARQGDPESALLFFKEAARLRPDEPGHASLCMTLTLVHLGRFDEASRIAVTLPRDELSGRFEKIISALRGLFDAEQNRLEAQREMDIARQEREEAGARLERIKGEWCEFLASLTSGLSTTA